MLTPPLLFGKVDNMEHHALSALIRRSGPEASRRALLFLHCFRRITLKPVDPPKDKVIAPESRHVGMDSETGADPSGTGFGTHLSVDCIVFLAHAMITFDCTPPKFVFAVCPASIVLRSADRGRTWRKISLSRSIAKSPSPPPPGAHSSEAPNSDAIPPCEGDDAKVLSDILNLLPSQGHPGPEGDIEADDDNDTDDDATRPGPPRGASACVSADRITTQPDLLGLACHKDTLAVCGEDGMLAVSVDRGVTYSYADPNRHLALIHNRTKSKHAMLAVRGVVFLNDTCLAFYTSNQVCRIAFTVQGLNSVVFDGPASSMLKLPRGPIGGMWTMDWASGGSDAHGGCSTVRPLWLSTMSLLRCTCDGGASWLPVPHSIGLVRSAVFACPGGPRPPAHPEWSTALSGVGIAPVAQASTMDAHAPPSAIPQSDVATKDPKVPPPQKKYTFALESTYSAPADEVAHVSKSMMVLKNECSFHPSLIAPSASGGRTQRQGGGACAARSDVDDEVVFMVCYALSSNGNIVPYDFTSVLHIVCRLDGRDVRLHTFASRVDYLPFVQSTIQDRVGIAMAPRRSDDEGGDSHVLVRSTAAGISTSRSYGESWSEPARSFTGTCCRLDEGCFVFGCQRKSIVVTEDYGSTFKGYALATNMRVAVVTDIAVMR